MLNVFFSSSNWDDTLSLTVLYYIHLSICPVPARRGLVPINLQWSLYTLDRRHIGQITMHTYTHTDAKKNLTEHLFLWTVGGRWRDIRVNGDNMQTRVVETERQPVIEVTPSTLSCSLIRCCNILHFRCSSLDEKQAYKGFKHNISCIHVDMLATKGTNGKAHVWFIYKIMALLKQPPMEVSSSQPWLAQSFFCSFLVVKIQLAYPISFICGVLAELLP